MAITGSKVMRVLERETWTLIQSTREAGPSLLRLRTPVIRTGEGDQHVHLLQVVWPYADEGEGEMPSQSQSDEMRTFEDRLCSAWERDGMGFLAAVLTFDGARQWVFYVQDVAECSERLHDMPEEDDPYPIELTTRHDPSWQFLHDELLPTVVAGMDPAEWESLHAE